VFEKCPIIDRKCGFAGKYKGSLYCGVKTGILESNRIYNMTKCPKKTKKKRGR